MPRLGEGPVPARIMLVGESWGYDDERVGAPFQGESGKELNRMLGEAGIMRSECYLTNLVNARPPTGNLLASIAITKKDQARVMTTLNGGWLRDKVVSKQILTGYSRLLREITLVQPNVIVAMGNSAIWALTGHWGAIKWRGSMLRLEPFFKGQELAERPKLIPTLAPWTIAAAWDMRALMVTDLRRAHAEAGSRSYTNIPRWNFILRPGFQTTIDTLELLYDHAERLEDGNTAQQLWLDFDLETRAGHIACAGISWSRTEAICIPFMQEGVVDGYWEEHEEGEIVHLLYKLLTHPKVSVRGQNLLYDAQYTHRHWHFIPNVKQDTMIAAHTAFVALPKSLDFLASMHCAHYVQWKPEKSSWKGS